MQYLQCFVKINNVKNKKMCHKKYNWIGKLKIRKSKQQFYFLRNKRISFLRRKYIKYTYFRYKKLNYFFVIEAPNQILKLICLIKYFILIYFQKKSTTKKNLIIKPIDIINGIDKRT